MNVDRRTIQLVALSLIVSVAGCSMTSTIHRTNGPAYEAEIVGSDADALHVRADNGFTYRVPRDDVADVDYPGNVVFAVGAALTAVGAIAIAGITSNGGSNARSDAVVIGSIYGLPGLFLMGGGAFNYLTARSRSRNFETAVVTPRLPPVDLRYRPPPEPLPAPPSLPPQPVPPAPPPQPYSPPPDGGPPGG